MHVVVVDGQNGAVKSAQVFDTYEGSEEIHQFIDAGLPAGDVVIAASKDDCSKMLTHKTKDWFQTLGSTEILKLDYRQAFAFVGVAGSAQALEKRGLGRADQASVQQVFGGRNRSKLATADADGWLTVDLPYLEAVESALEVLYDEDDHVIVARAQ